MVFYVYAGTAVVYMYNKFIFVNGFIFGVDQPGGQLLFIRFGVFVQRPVDRGQAAGIGHYPGSVERTVADFKKQGGKRGSVPQIVRDFETQGQGSRENIAVVGLVA